MNFCNGQKSVQNITALMKKYKHRRFVSMCERDLFPTSGTTPLNNAGLLLNEAFTRFPLQSKWMAKGMLSYVLKKKDENHHVFTSSGCEGLLYPSHICSHASVFLLYVAYILRLGNGKVSNLCGGNPASALVKWRSSWRCSSASIDLVRTHRCVSAFSFA